mgnify:CR=1 FL=1
MSTQAHPFVHLRLHTEFSIREGIVKIPDAVKRAAAEGMPALAITDVMNVFGLVKFYKACRSAGVKPIIGVDARVAHPDAPNDPERALELLLIVRNRDGYRQLCELVSRAWLENQHRGQALLRPEWLTRETCAGLMALSGGARGVLAPALLAGETRGAKAALAHWAGCFPDGAFFVEVQRAGLPNEAEYLAAAVPFAAELGVPVVATHPIQFLRPEDFTAHEVRFCIAEGYVLNDPNRPRPFTEAQYFLSAEEMADRFADLPEALENTLLIAQKANLTITLGKSFLPAFPTPEGMSLDEFFVSEAKRGLAARLEERFPDPEERERERPRYEKRLAFECDTIIQMGFPGYFLIVADFINWAKQNDVPVGPGRGSGAGSLVAYALRITDLDPLAYALLFERFLNPERVSMPDFDVDFCQEKRYRVIDYVRRRYGAEAVSQIATFGSMASKAVVRDVGRVLGLPYGLCDRISKLIPTEGVKPVSLAKALELEPQLQELMEDPQDGEAIRQLFELAQPLEGLTRNVGMHAGGVLIAPGKITDFCPLFVQEGDDPSPVSQFDKDDVEAVGLVKFDFLGLRNLTIIREALDQIERLTGARPDLARMGFDDPQTYQLLRDANTTAVFQLESEGMKKLLKKLQPDRFEDIIAVLALYRPGPLGSGMVDDFILRKQGKQAIDYFHPDLKACLEPTYGVIVYQEQVMQIAQIIGGYTLGAADLLRRAMGKKKPEEMAKHREIFRQGAIERGYDEALAMRLFDLMEKFAEYGFNKSHTAAYAVVTYQTAWLKRHHPAPFFAATLSSDMDDTDAVKTFFDDACANGLTVLPPDVNVSEYRFQAIDAATIRYGLGAIKGVGEPAANAIVTERQQHGPFHDLFDLVSRVDRRVVNRRVLEQLVRAGALDTLPGHTHLRAPDGLCDRARLFASVGLALEVAEQRAASAQQCGLFDDEPEANGSYTPEFPAVRPWTERERLKEEKLAIGFFLSGHPFTAFAAELRQTVPTKLAQLAPSRDAVWVCGVVVELRTKMGARGRMAFVTLDDGSEPCEVLFYREVFDAVRQIVVVDEPLVVRVKVAPDDYSGGVRVVAEEALSLPQWRARQLKAIEITIPESVVDSPVSAQRLSETIEAFRVPSASPEGAKIEMRVAFPEGAVVALRAARDAIRVKPEDALLTELRGFPELAVRLRY